MESQAKVLVVDDEPGGRLVLQAFLKVPNYEVLLAKDGFEAVEMAKVHMPDLVLLDVMMPHMDGYEVCRRLRADPILAEIPILMLTALGDRDSRLRGIEAGADDFLTKPFDREELRIRVKSIIRLNRFRRIMTERARFVWAVDQAKEGYCILDEKDRIVYANPAANSYLNISPDDRSQKVFSKWIRTQYVCEPEELWNNWLSSEGGSAPLFMIRPESERSKAVWLQVEVLNLPAGRNAGLLVRIIDQTERMTLQKDLWSFHGAINHKLRTPISNILMIGELLQQQQDPQTRTLAGSLLQQAQRLYSEVNDVLGYLNAGSITQTGSFFKLSDMPQAVQNACKELGIERVVTKVTRLANPDSFLKISVRAMTIVIHEILQNSVKFHPFLDPGIEVEIDQTIENMVSIEFRDDGVFLLPEELKRVWIPYYQVEREFTGEIAGMGLGLSTVSTLVWEIGGRVRMVNREDRPGVVVQLLIPVNPQSSI